MCKQQKLRSTCNSADAFKGTNSAMFSFASLFFLDHAIEPLTHFNHFLAWENDLGPVVQN